MSARKRKYDTIDDYDERYSICIHACESKQTPAAVYDPRQLLRTISGVEIGRDPFPSACSDPGIAGSALRKACLAGSDV